jgi:membrane associated rhomboid family serine protease
MLLIPYRVDVAVRRWPIANFAIIGSCVAVHLYSYALPDAAVRDFVRGLATDGQNPLRLFTHMWVHDGFFHLLANMAFLWIFGNAVCAKIGNWPYLLLYVAFGMVGGSIHGLWGDLPAVGASGAVNGVVGCFLVFYPLNDLSCLLVVVLWPFWFTVSSYWMILVFLVLDVIGVALGGMKTAYFAHLGGFFAGFAAMVAGLRLGLVRLTPDEWSIFEAFKDHGFRYEPIYRDLPDGDQWNTVKEPAEPVHLETFIAEIEGDDAPLALPTSSNKARPSAVDAELGPSTMAAFIELAEAQLAEDEAAPLPPHVADPPGGPAGSDHEPGSPEPLADAPGVIHFACPCGQALHVSSRAAGREGVCPACGRTLQVPAPGSLPSHSAE